MIAGIDSQADIFLYLDKKELERLLTETIQGVLVKRERPKRQGTISISINDARKREQGSNGIGIEDTKYWKVRDGFHVDVFMGSEWYPQLQEQGMIGTRHRMLDGSKIHVYDRTKLKGLEIINVEGLEHYRDNKDKLLDFMG